MYLSIAYVLQSAKNEVYIMPNVVDRKMGCLRHLCVKEIQNLLKAVIVKFLAD